MGYKARALFANQEHARWDIGASNLARNRLVLHLVPFFAIGVIEGFVLTSRRMLQ
jgi:hypothetical protein